MLDGRPPSDVTGLVFYRRYLARRVFGAKILVGEEDEFVPVTQGAAYVAALTGARSVEKACYDRASGGAEHCQEGASTLWHETFFDWLLRRFPG